MDYLTLASHAERVYAEDTIGAMNRLAKERTKTLGSQAVINATLGECVNDDGKLMVLPTVEQLLRKMPIEDFCSYAPIGGIANWNEAVQQSLFGELWSQHFIESVPTPGGCGALRHAVWNFLDDGQSAITTNYCWQPYHGICKEHNRGLETFEMFTTDGAFNLNALERTLTEVSKKQNQLLLILNTPAQNPTGYSMSAQEIRQVMELIHRCASDKSKRITLCLDVSYIDFAGDFAKSREFFHSIGTLDKNVLVVLVYSMSKSYTLCGMRCGALICMAQSEMAAKRFKEAMCFSSRSTWSNVVRCAQKLLTTIELNPDLKAQVTLEREVFKNTIAQRGMAFLQQARTLNLPCCPYDNGYFITIPCENPLAVAERLQESNLFIVPLPDGLRFSPCAVTLEKCKRAPALISQAICAH